MKTQLESAKEGVITPQIAKVAADEGFEPEEIRKKVALGEIVIPCNPNRPNQRVVGIGSGLENQSQCFYRNIFGYLRYGFGNPQGKSCRRRRRWIR